MHSSLLYLQIADSVARLISSGALKGGDKIPSVRAMAKKQGVSVGTVQQAYLYLEGEGLVEARPKSGYYVKAIRASHTAGLPQGPQMDTKPVAAKEIVSTVFNNIADSKVISFSVSAPSPELLPLAKLSKSMIHALSNAPSAGLMYENIYGNIELRQQLASLSLHWQGSTRPEDVVITAGCMEAISLCLNATTNTGDTVAVEHPTYFGIIQLLEAMGLKALPLPCDPCTGPSLDGLEKAITLHGIKTAVLVSNFNNPSGSLIPDEQKEAIVKLFNKYQLPLIEDDLYGELYFGERRPRTLKSFDSEGRVYYCSSLSKSLAPGYRIGWCIPGKEMSSVARFKLSQNVSTNTLAQYAIQHFLAYGRYEQHLRRLRSSLHTNSLRYSQAIADYFPSGTTISQPEGGFVLWLALPTETDTFDLYKRTIKHNIAFAPGTIFSVDGNFKSYMRLSFGQPFNTAVDNGLKLLGKFANH